MREIKSRKMEIKLERKIDYIEISNGYIAYKDSFVTSDGEVVTSEEGISKINLIESISCKESIPCVSKSLINRDVEKLHRTISMRYNKMEYFELYDELVVDEPYTYLVENLNQVNDDVALYELDYISGDLLTLEGDILPKAMYFDSLNGNMSDKEYDLDKVLSYLRDRKDIYLIDDAIVKVDDIISLNTNEIRFIYKPSVDSFDKFNTGNYKNIRELVLETIGLNRFKI